SLGALVYGVALVSLVIFTKPRLQLPIAILLVSVVLIYPLLRAADLFPTNDLIDAAELVSTDRAESLGSRFKQDQQLLGRESLRLRFGWGRWGRSRVYDKETGQDVSVTDGRWIITLGQFGLFGFVTEFGLLMLPVFRAASALKFATSMHDEIMLAALALIV